jgi:hypothetical protein
MQMNERRRGGNGAVRSRMGSVRIVRVGNVSWSERDVSVRELLMVR